MGHVDDREGQILAALAAAPLDRVRLMKTLFLVWYRAGQPGNWPFSFEPYLYGPCAFDLYRVLDGLGRKNWVVQVPHLVTRWAPYRLTEAGRLAAAIARQQDPTMAGAVGEVARWASGRGFRELLDAVYAEAPAFAIRSVLRASG
jgi:hypothetical protein